MVRTIRGILVELVMTILNLFRQNSKVAYYIGTIHIYFIHEWMEQWLWLTNIFTGPKQENPSGRK